MTAATGFHQRSLVFGVVCAGLAGLVGLPAFGQIVLPGAVAPTPEVTPPAPKPPRPKAKPSGGSEPAGTPVQVTGVSSFAGRTFYLNGGKTQISFASHDRLVDVARLLFSGESMSNTRAVCQVELQASPVGVKSLGRPAGVERIQIDFPACPLAFDVLDGAALVDPAQAVCEFKAADCRVNPVGLWGPQPVDLGPDKDKAIERARAHAEVAVRSNYKALAASTKDRAAIMGFAREQAQFSSTREETCRDYAGEGRHGYCATKLTEARAALLRVRLGEALAAKAARKAKQKTGRTKTP